MARLVLCITALLALCHACPSDPNRSLKFSYKGGVSMSAATGDSITVRSPTRVPDNLAIAMWASVSANTTTRDQMLVSYHWPVVFGLGIRSTDGRMFATFDQETYAFSANATGCRRDGQWHFLVFKIQTVERSTIGSAVDVSLSVSVDGELIDGLCQLQQYHQFGLFALAYDDTASFGYKFGPFDGRLATVHVRDNVNDIPELALRQISGEKQGDWTATADALFELNQQYGWSDRIVFEQPLSPFAASGAAAITFTGSPVYTPGQCNPSPCLNGGTCVTGAQNATCACPYAARGTFCERVFSTTTCSPGPTTCHPYNSVRCIEQINPADQHCECYAGFTGFTCDKSIPNPSAGGGVGSPYPSDSTTSTAATAYEEPILALAFVLAASVARLFL